MSRKFNEGVGTAERAQIATSAGSLVAHFRADIPAVDECEVGECFPVHLASSLDLSGVGRIRRIGKRAPFANYWHVQIRASGEAVLCAYARCEDGTWETINVFGEQLAPAVGEAISWIDTNLPTADQPRLLLIPEQGVFAIWLDVGGNDRIVLVSGTKRHSGLIANRAYTPHLFFRTLFGPG